MKQNKLRKAIIDGSKNPVVSNLMVLLITGFCSFAFVKSCEERKLTNTKFDFDPANTGVNFVSIFKGYDKKDSGFNNELYADFSKSDTIYVTVFTYYRNGGTEIIEKPKVKYETKSEIGTSERFIFYAELNSGNAPKIIDNTILRNLPSKWKIEYYTSHNQNNHGGFNGCDEKFQYNLDLNKKDVRNLFDDGYQVRDRLELDGKAWCSQGNIAVMYRIIKLK